MYKQTSAQPASTSSAARPNFHQARSITSIGALQAGAKNPVMGIGYPMNLANIMGDPEHCGLPPPDFLKQPGFNRFRAVVVEVGGGFVQ